MESAPVTKQQKRDGFVQSRGIGSAIVEDSGEGEGWAAVSKWIGSTISMDKIDGPGKKDGGPDSPEIALLNPIFELSRKLDHQDCDCKNCYALFEHPLGHRDCPMIKKRVSFAKEVAPTGSVPTEALLLEFEKGLLGQLDLQEFLEEQKNQKQEEKVKFLEKEVAKLKKALDG
ncbi:Protein CBG27066 [Caenorhabditis briggsae]|uniref:Protein CBG27066 n=1 Tax=Caenorhabditis briggsae TaxID=6238 RepID=B6IMD0_CAEBR|nr:Protein CBG27066 [Caenorhabditis briggsae]CAS01060.1 Protein CBG27066 [Caenorhabditis briggsae]